jgi:hypothetical protein
MAAYPIWVITVLLGTVVFVPLFVIALIRLPTARVAFIVSASFSIGAMVGFFLSWLLALQVIPRHLDEAWNGIPVFVFVAAGAIGGAALALGLARKAAR